MTIVNKVMRLLIFILLIKNICCQDGYTDQTNMRMHQIGSNGEQVETMTGYTKNTQSDPNSPSILSSNVQYRIDADANKQSDYYKAERGRARKVFRIKNPFQQPAEEDIGKQQNMTNSSPDTETGSSNQYPSMHYSLPPEEFLQKIQAENKYYPQQHQVSTPDPTFGYTITPQPQYQYSTISVSNYNSGNPQNNPLLQSESNFPYQFYNHNLNNYQYNNAFSYGLDGFQSTPSSVTLYLSTTPPSNQYIGTPSSSYVSSSSPIYLSSPTNLQPYISSTLSNPQTGSPNDYKNYEQSKALESNLFNYGITNNRETDQQIKVNHYDNSAIGVQYPISEQRQHSNDFQSSTPMPTSSTSSAYPDSSHDFWHNSKNYDLNSISSMRQETSQGNQQNIQSNNQETHQVTNHGNQNTDTHRVGSMPSANNLFLNIIRPDHQTLTNLKNNGNYIDEQNKKSDVYSHGDYGWKLEGGKPSVKFDVTTPDQNNQNYKSNNQGDRNSMGVLNHFIDNGKVNDYDQTSKLNSEKLEAQEFAKAAAKAHEIMKEQHKSYLNTYPHNENYPHNVSPNTELRSVAFGNIIKKNNVHDNINPFVNAPPDFITIPPYFFSNSRESGFDNRIKQTYNNINKNIQNGVKNEVSNISPNIDEQFKMNNGRESYNEHNVTNDGIDSNEQFFKQFLKPVTQTNQKENLMYGYNFRSNPNDVLSPDLSKRLEPNFENSKQYMSMYNSNNLQYKQQFDRNIPSPNLAQSNIDNNQYQHNVQYNIQRLQNQETPDINNNLKLNDIPYWLTQSLNTGSFRMNNNYDHKILSTPSPIILNQNVDSHQLDVAASILNKLMRDKQIEINSKLDYNAQSGTLLPTMNRLKVDNPYNIDFKLATEILRGKSVSNNMNTVFSNQYNQANPLRWDISSLHQVTSKNDNIGNLGVLNEDINSYNSPFFELHNSGHYPYQGVKYSRSEEEGESLEPITSSSHTHPIVAIAEQDVLANNKEVNESDETSSTDEFSIESEDTIKSPSIQRIVNGKHKHSSSNSPNRHFSQRKIPFVEEPYPLLKPPPMHTSRGKNRNRFEIGNRRQRVNKIKLSRIVKREPLFEDESFSEELKPLLESLPSVVEDDSDSLLNKEIE